ncbi:MAG: nucleoside permease [Steroidobacteraceae bacterium]
MRNTTIRLGLMMFLEFFIWGGWFVTLGTFLAKTFSATGSQTAMAFSTQSWGAIVAPFIIGLIADKFFNAEKILGVLHLIGAVLMYQMYAAGSFEQFYPYVLGYMVVYMPTLALVNSVSFRHLTDTSKEFGKVRVWGTIGWIVAGGAISLFGWDSADESAAGALKNTFFMCSVVSCLLGLYSFTLPSTPPQRSDTEMSEKLGLSALKLLRDRNFAVFVLASILICIPLAFYYQNASPFLTELGTASPTAKLSIGQVSEVLFMLLLPVFLGRFGIKKTLLLGMIAWAVRYLLFALGASSNSVSLLILGIAMHGLCYDFFFVSGQIYTDAKAGAASKSSAQGMITLATYGVGMLVGFWVAGKISDMHVIGATHDWYQIWLVPSALAAVIFILFLIAFKPERVRAD